MVAIAKQALFASCHEEIPDFWYMLYFIHSQNLEGVFIFHTAKQFSAVKWCRSNKQAIEQKTQLDVLVYYLIRLP